MSVTDGGVFPALQSSWHAHISLSFPLFPTLSCFDLLLRLDDQEWEALSRERTTSSLAQLCLMFHAKNCRYIAFHPGWKNEASYTNCHILSDDLNYTRRKNFNAEEFANLLLTRSFTLPSCPGGPGSPFSPGGPIGPTMPRSPMRPLSPWTPLSPGMPGSPYVKKKALLFLSLPSVQIPHVYVTHRFFLVETYL